MKAARFIGVDLAWREDAQGLVANESGVAAIDATGRVLDAGWSRGLDETIAWIEAAAADGPALLFVDAPLVVDNPKGQRPCENPGRSAVRTVGVQREHHQSTLAALGRSPAPRAAALLRMAVLRWPRWAIVRPPRDFRVLPVHDPGGVPELGYNRERPRYKRKPRGLPAAQWRTQRAATCDDMIGRLARLNIADPPLLPQCGM
jgi:hypothetical protein